MNFLEEENNIMKNTTILIFASYGFLSFIRDIYNEYFKPKPIIKIKFESSSESDVSSESDISSDSDSIIIIPQNEKDKVEEGKIKKKIN